MRALSEDRRRLWTATWKPKASHVWTNSAVFTDFTVFPPKYQEDSQLKTGWRQELGEMRAMNSRGPLLTFITSCGKTAEALGDAFHLLNKGFCPVRFHIHPLQFFFFFSCFDSDTMDTKRHNFSKAHASSRCSMPFGFTIWRDSIARPRGTHGLHRRTPYFQVVEKV